MKRMQCLKFAFRKIKNGLQRSQKPIFLLRKRKYLMILPEIKKIEKIILKYQREMKKYTFKKFQLHALQLENRNQNINVFANIINYISQKNQLRYCYKKIYMFTIHQKIKETKKRIKESEKAQLFYQQQEEQFFAKNNKNLSLNIQGKCLNFIFSKLCNRQMKMGFSQIKQFAQNQKIQIKKMAQISRQKTQTYLHKNNSKCQKVVTFQEAELKLNKSKVLALKILVKQLQRNLYDYFFKKLKQNSKLVSEVNSKLQKFFSLLDNCLYIQQFHIQREAFFKIQIHSQNKKERQKIICFILKKLARRLKVQQKQALRKIQWFAIEKQQYELHEKLQKYGIFQIQQTFQKLEKKLTKFKQHCFYAILEYSFEKSLQQKKIEDFRKRAIHFIARRKKFEQNASKCFSPINNCSPCDSKLGFEKLISPFNNPHQFLSPMTPKICVNNFQQINKARSINKLQMDNSSFTSNIIKTQRSYFSEKIQYKNKQSLKKKNNKRKKKKSYHNNYIKKMKNHKTSAKQRNYGYKSQRNGKQGHCNTKRKVSYQSRAKQKRKKPKINDFMTQEVFERSKILNQLSMY